MGDTGSRERQSRLAFPVNQMRVLLSQARWRSKRGPWGGRFALNFFVSNNFPSTRGRHNITIYRNKLSFNRRRIRSTVNRQGCLWTFNYNCVTLRPQTIENTSLAIRDWSNRGMSPLWGWNIGRLGFSVSWSNMTKSPAMLAKAWEGLVNNLLVKYTAIRESNLNRVRQIREQINFHQHPGIQ